MELFTCNVSYQIHFVYLQINRAHPFLLIKELQNPILLFPFFFFMYMFTSSSRLHLCWFDRKTAPLAVEVHREPFREEHWGREKLAGESRWRTNHLSFKCSVFIIDMFIKDIQLNYFFPFCCFKLLTIFLPFTNIILCLGKQFLTELCLHKEEGPSQLPLSPEFKMAVLADAQTWKL